MGDSLKIEASVPSNLRSLGILGSKGGKIDTALRPRAATASKAEFPIKNNKEMHFFQFHICHFLYFGK